MKGSVRIAGVVLVLILSFSTGRGEAQGTVADVTLASARPVGVAQEVDAAANRSGSRPNHHSVRPVRVWR